MDINQFGKISHLYLTSTAKQGKTILSDISFTAPYKIMRPFERKDGSIQVMLLAASAGIMEGDRQEFNFDIQSGSNLEFTSQSYDKIHQMISGCAKRFTKIKVAPNANFCFNPQPTIPFKDSAFENTMYIELADTSSKFQMSEIFSCGRYIRGEKFMYRHYYNFVKIYRQGKLIYRDNTRYDPQEFAMEGMGMYEAYTHLANIFISIPQNPDEFSSQVYKLLQSYPETDITGGITKLSAGDFAIRIFGHRAQVLEQLTKQIFTLL